MNCEVMKSISGEVTASHRIGIVAACKNRQETLEKVLPTWLDVDGVKEVIIVDWGSDPPLRSIVRPERDPRIKLFRVNEEELWVLSRAYNLAFNKSTMDYIIRIDCDYSLNRAFMNAHNLKKTETGFYSGNWGNARDENEEHLNGAMIMRRALFWDIGGYDERIQTYGWDDSDLYNRLTSKNMAKFNLSYDHISHVSHGDESRTPASMQVPKVEIEVNRLLLEKLPQWSAAFVHSKKASRYKVINEEKGYVELEAEHIPDPLRKIVPRELYDNTVSIAFGTRLADDHLVPWEILATIETDKRKLMLNSLQNLQKAIKWDIEQSKMGKSKGRDSKVLPTYARLLFVHCMHGLGNRLRVLGSALAFARNTRRVPVIIWERDAHIAAEFHSLFKVQNFIVMKKFNLPLPATHFDQYSGPWKNFYFYNYMEMEENARKGEVITNNPDKHLYYKGAYVMEAPDYTWWEASNVHLRKLQPVDIVHDHLSKLIAQNISEAIGVHIRNRTLARDIKNVDFEKEYGSKAAKKMEYWREQSCFRTFMGEMNRIIRKVNSEAKFYIATDTYMIIPLLEKRFPGRILSTKRSCDDRNSKCMIYALIDMYALSRTKQLLGSNWSSYTEMIERLSGLKARLAGQDFKGEWKESNQIKGSMEDIILKINARAGSGKSFAIDRP